MEVSESSALEKLASMAPSTASAKPMTYAELRNAEAFLDCDEHGQWSTKNHHACPKCKTIASSNRIDKTCRIPKGLRGKTLGDYIPLNAKARERYKAIGDYLAAFHHSRKIGRSLILSGKVGTGKTMLAVGLLKAVALCGYSGKYMTVTELGRMFDKSREHGNQQRMVDRLANLDLLVLDEVGRRSNTPAAKNQLFEIIDRRRGNNAPTILVSNLPMISDDDKQTLPEYMTEAAIDRMREGGGKVLTFNWESYRR